MNLVNDTQQIFVVGGRSGTTMMGRILDKHPSIFTFRELHFFGTIWTNKNRKLENNEQIKLLSKITYHSRVWYI